MATEWSPASCVKTIKTGSDSSALPVWVMPLFGGTTSCFDELFNAFDGYKRTLFGLTDPYLVGNDDALTCSFEAWIDMYVSAMLSKQPRGPFTLIGYSQGMHWVWALSEALAKKGLATDAVLVIDPNFPSWNGLDRVVPWNGPQMCAATGAPFCILKHVMGGIMSGLKSKAKWETQASREATAVSFLKEAEKVDHFEDLMIHMEMDTGKEIHPTPADAIKKWPPAERSRETAKLVAAKVEGVQPEFIEKALRFRAVAFSRWFGYKPYVLPKDVKFTIVFADRAHFGYDPQTKYSVLQGFERFLELGYSQIDEVVVKVPKKKSPATAKLVGDSKAWELHFRVMHYPPIFPVLKAKALDKLGLFTPSAKCTLDAAKLVPDVEEAEPPAASKLPIVLALVVVGVAAYAAYAKFGM